MKAGAAALIVLALLLSGCEESVHDMYVQPKDMPLRPSALFPDGRASQEAPARTVAVTAEAAPAAPAITTTVLARGRNRYDIYCAPCHGRGGDGDGMLPQRGFPHPPSYHSERLRQAPDRHLYDVISQGYGVMYPYGDRVTPEDRWAIVAYIRALQLSRDAKVAQLPAADRHALEDLP